MELNRTSFDHEKGIRKIRLLIEQGNTVRTKGWSSQHRTETFVRLHETCETKLKHCNTSYNYVSWKLNFH